MVVAGCFRQYFCGFVCILAVNIMIQRIAKSAAEKCFDLAYGLFYNRNKQYEISMIKPVKRQNERKIWIKNW